MPRIPGQDNFALVAYVPDPLASFLYEMRRSFSGMPCPQPHITILPPRPLRTSSEHACQSAKEVLAAQTQFEVELTRVCCFASTNTLYLDINDGAAEIVALHDSLNQGVLFHQEEFDFRPHLTLAGSVPTLHLSSMLHQAEARWRTASPYRFVLSEIVCLLQTGDGTDDGWQRLWSVKLNTVPPGGLATANDLFASTEQQ
jgi:2'-5' RNA ligase